MDEETQLLIDTFATCKKLLQTVLHSTLQNPKSAKISEESRKEGNVLFSQKSHSDESHSQVLFLYNKSAAFAPSDSQELASAYANRSAFLLHIGKYQECIQDIDKALEIHTSDIWKIKLLCRKDECLKTLGVSCENVLGEVQILIDKFDDAKIKKSFEEMVKKVSTMSVTKKIEVDHQKHKIIDLCVTDDVLKKVCIKHDKKYGRHLVAEQNFNPGDIIFVEELLSASLKTEYFCTNCHHCLKICWNSVPCNHCTWATFCSKDCSDEAWQEYHDIECSLGTLMISIFEDLRSIFNPTVVKIFVKAIKDAGSIEKLKAQLETVDKNTDVCYKGFCKDGKFNSNTIESFYSLTKRNFASKEMSSLAVSTLIIMIGLAKNPQINSLQLSKVEDLIQNKDLVFLGSLLLRLLKIHSNNSYSFTHFLTHELIQFGVPQRKRGSCVASLISLLNHSCIPNSNVLFTNDGKAIVYALQPIKKNDQIFTTYSREYCTTRLELRKDDLKKYNFECDCQACVEAWPPVLLDNFQRLVNGQNEQNPAETKFVQKHNVMLENVEKNNYNEASLKILASQVTLAFKKLKQPSPFTCKLQELLGKCISNIYNGLKPEFHGECKLLDDTSRSIINIYNDNLHTNF